MHTKLTLLPTRLLLLHLSAQKSGKMADSLAFKGTLAGHSNWITAIATSSENPDMILTASRGASFFFGWGPVTGTREGVMEP